MSDGLITILGVGGVIWVLISMSILRYFEPDMSNSNPFRNMWNEFDFYNYNFLGKSILLILNTILGLPTLIIWYFIALPILWCTKLIVYCFDKLFKKK